MIIKIRLEKSHVSKREKRGKKTGSSYSGKIGDGLRLIANNV